MASEAILKQKQGIVEEIKNKIENAKTIVLFDYRGLTDAEIKELRRKLRDSQSDYKVYKNTLMDRAFTDLNINLTEELKGPSAFAYGEDQVAPVKILSEFAKTHEALVLKVGIIDGEIADKAKLAEYATLPSRDELLTMLAGGMIGIVRDLSIALNLYAEQKEDGSVKEEATKVEETATEEPVVEEVQEESTEAPAEEAAPEVAEESPVEEAPAEEVVEQPVEETTETAEESAE